MYWLWWPLRFGLMLVVCLYKDDYLHIFKGLSFWFNGCCGEKEGLFRKPVNHTNWMTAIQPKVLWIGLQSLCNRTFWRRFLLLLCFYLSFSWNVGFLLELSQLSFFWIVGMLLAFMLTPLKIVYLFILSLYKTDSVQVSQFVSFWLHSYCDEWEVLARKNLNHTCLLLFKLKFLCRSAIAV